MGSTLVEVISLVLGIVSSLVFIACSTTDCWRAIQQAMIILRVQKLLATNHTYIQPMMVGGAFGNCILLVAFAINKQSRRTFLLHMIMYLSLCCSVMSASETLSTFPTYVAGEMAGEQDAKDPYSSVGLSSRCRGLWSECVYDHMANIWTCDIPISYLSEHPVPLVATRALVIVNAILTFTSTPLLVLGMKCTKFISREDDLKRKLSQAAGLMLLLGGVCGGVALFWYAVDTVLKYRMEVVLTVPGITYELGYSYWFAAGSTGCACIAAFLLLSMNCRRDITAETKSASAILRRPHNNAMTYL